MPDNKQKRVRGNIRNPEERIKDFNEAEPGYNEESAKREAARCLHCKHRPCVSGCPVGIDIPEFIGMIEKGDPEAAYRVIYGSSAFPAVCGRVCPQEKQCEARCVRGIRGDSISIGKLERYAADYHIKNHASDSPGTAVSNTKGKVAVIGSGPSGLSCARELAAAGYDVTVYEALHRAGGVLAYGIPEFRLPLNVTEREIEEIRRLGVKILTNMVIGNILSPDDIFDMGFEALYIATGAGLPNFIGIPGEDLPGVYAANEFLTRINLMRAYDKSYDTPINIPERAVVVGGGNVAMDAARCAVRLGAGSVAVMYRRTRDEMPARLEEITHAEEEGIKFMFLSNPKEIIGDKNGASRILYEEMTLSDPDKSGRRRPVPKGTDILEYECDCVIIAVGNSPNTLITRESEEIKCDEKGRIIVNEATLETSKPFTYAGGDAVTGAATVILAMAAGKQAALSIDKALSLKRNEEL